MKHTDAYTLVQRRLSDLENTEKVYIPYACESGSRAWGFASQNSDYDVRGIYVRPQKDYLSLHLKRDTIESITHEDAEIDVSLWDVFKAMRLLSKLNPQIIEWLYSSDQYRNELRYVRLALRNHINANHLRSSALFHHYRSMAMHNYVQYILGPTERGAPVRTKKYLYVLRPIVVLLYIKEHGVYPPLEFEATLNSITIDGFVHEVISVLLAQKRGGFETDEAAPELTLNAWIDGMLRDVVTEDRFITKSSDDTGNLQNLCQDALTYLLALMRELANNNFV